MSAVAIERVAASAWRARVEQALAEGLRPWSLHATGPRPGADGRPAAGVEVRLLLGRDGAAVLLETAPQDGAVPTLVDLLPTLGWDEREAHDLHGVRFAGHEPLRPLVHHDGPAWRTPVAGRDVHQVAVGPIHAGIIESGHFRFHVVGERIVHLDVQLFHKHRGLERAAEGRPLEEAASAVAHACGTGAVANQVAAAIAVERLRGLEADDDLRRERTLLLELERLYNHLDALSALCAGIGLAAGTHALGATKEEALRLNRRLVGHRYLFGAVAVGAGRLRLDADEARALAGEVRDLVARADRDWRDVAFLGSVRDRLAGVGVLEREAAQRWDATGVAARAAGHAVDARSDRAAPLAYDGLRPVLAEPATGDVAARTAQRVAELHQTADLLDALLDQPLEPGEADARPDAAQAAVGVGRVEDPRGACVCVVEPDGDRIGRLHLRTGSYGAWPVLATVVPGALVPDFPLINKSFELSYACVDR